MTGKRTVNKDMFRLVPLGHENDSVAAARAGQPGSSHFQWERCEFTSPFFSVGGVLTDNSRA
jgi:hypothetical protein